MGLQACSFTPHLTTWTCVQSWQSSTSSGCSCGTAGKQISPPVALVFFCSLATLCSLHVSCPLPFSQPWLYCQGCLLLGIILHVCFHTSVCMLMVWLPAGCWLLWIVCGEPVCSTFPLHRKCVKPVIKGRKTQKQSHIKKRSKTCKFANLETCQKQKLPHSAGWKAKLEAGHAAWLQMWFQPSGLKA